MKKLLIFLLLLFLFPAVVFGQATRVPSLEILIGSSTVGKRVEQLDLPSELVTGTSSGKRVILTAKDFVSSIFANGTITTGTINLVIVGDGTSTTTYDSVIKKGTITVTVTAGAKPNILENNIVVGTSSAGINFNGNHFDITESGGTSTVNLSDIQIGTTSASSGYLLKLNASGTVNAEQLPIPDFGTYTIKNVNTDYQATTAGLVVAYLHGTASGTNDYLLAYTDSSATPSTLITTAMIYYNTTAGNETYIQYDSLCMPVRKNHYYRVDITHVNPQHGTSTINFIPLGF